MVLENICPPALLYLAFSIIQIIIDLYRGETVQAFFKFIVMIIFTIVLNAICQSGMTIMSWFIVFIPFIMMTYITTILFFIFGINPSRMKPSDKKCHETQYGCCSDGVTAKEDMWGRSCPRMRLANVIQVTEPTASNNKDRHYLYPRGRSSRDYTIGGGSVTVNKKYVGIGDKRWRKPSDNKDELYYSKSKGWDKKSFSPKSSDSEFSYWKSRLNTANIEDILAEIAKSKVAGNNAPGSPTTSPISPPINEIKPVISGTPSIGLNLTSTLGKWNLTSATDFSYQWYRDTNKIDGQTSATYTVVLNDAGSIITCRVTGSNVAGSSTVISNGIPIPPPPPPKNRTPPSISPDTTTAGMLKVTPGEWEGTPAPTLSYQWYKGGTSAIAGAVGTTYMTTLTDAGSTITCKETGKNTGGSVTVTSSNSFTVPTVPPVPTVPT